MISAGAGLADIFKSKDKVKEVQKVIDNDYQRTEKVKETFEKIWGKCEAVGTNHPKLNFSPDVVFAVLLVCCIK